MGREEPTAKRRRWTLWLLAALAGVLVLSIGAAAGRARAALPQTAGRVEVAGLGGRVEILRDADDVPHIRAASEADAIFTLGYLHAQDRLWQMEFQRRVGYGRLAEILGEPGLAADKLFRTLGIARVARQALTRLDPDARAVLDAYVRGVNAFVASRRRWQLPVEFALLGIEPEPWRPEDAIVWQKVLAWSLSMNWREELLRVGLAARVGLDGAYELTPAYTMDGPIILEELPRLARLPRAPAALARDDLGPTLPNADIPRLGLPGGAAARARDAVAWQPMGDITSRGLMRFVPSGGASNNWVLAGSRTATGKPILANDPHLGAQAPAVWYLAHLTGGRLDVMGATLPGTPGVVIGRNRRIAWGVTNVMADVQDLFIERINARNEALYNGVWEPMQIAREVIKVKGRPDVTLLVRSTRHGPLISDILDGARDALALRWTALDEDDHTLEAFAGINVAGSWNEFVAALRRYHVPLQNFVYADVDGNIGYASFGAIPIRAKGDGTIPVPGWTNEHDWTGYVPLDSLPQLSNPGRGFIVSANNKVASDDYPYVISTSWEPPYRAARIVDAITSKERLSPGDVAAIQGDLRSAQVKALLPFLLRVQPEDERSREALERLRRWDGALAGDSPEAAIFEGWYAAFARRLFGDELGERVWDAYWEYRAVVAKAVHELVRSSRGAWCDDVRTAAVESCETIAAEALAEALTQAASVQGTGNFDRWRWDRANRLSFPHAPLDAVRLFRPFFSRTVAVGGDGFTVNPTMPIGDRIFIASYRQVIDFSEADASRFVIPMGQSGQVLSGRYSNLMDDWRELRYLPMRFTREAVDRAVKARLVLEPQR